MTRGYTAITYLAPSVPRAYFQTLVDYLAGTLGISIELQVDETRSGPGRSATESNPFADGTGDIGFVCSSSYVWLTAQAPPSVRLAAAPVYDDPRASGRPVYFSDVVVAQASRWRELSDLEGACLAINEESSLSGYHALRARMDLGLLGRVLTSGSHLDSLAMVVDGRADVAAIDSSVLNQQRGVSVRRLESLGPFPSPPVVLRADSSLEISSALCAAHENPLVRAAMATAGVARFAVVEPRDYQPVRELLAT